MEDYTRDGRYVIRADLPGLDPGKDIDITVDAGVLSIRAERREEHQEERRSEFRYGSLSRSVTLSAADADLERITASYEQGILEVSGPIAAKAKPEGRSIASRIAAEPATVDGARRFTRARP